MNSEAKAYLAKGDRRSMTTVTYPGGPAVWTAGGEPYFAQALHAMQGRAVVVQTVRDTVRGVVADIRPDYLVVRSDNALFFIRVRQIVWISPS